MDLTWSHQAIRSGVLPGQADLADMRPRQPQLPASASNQPGPPVGRLCVAWADRGPTECLLEEAEGVLDGESPQIPAPHNAQVSRQRTADPGQPQGPRWQLLVGQALDLDADHAERRLWRATYVELGPHIDADGAVRRVVQLRGLLRLAMCARVRQPKRLTVQPRPAAAWVLFGSAVHHAALD